MPRYSREKIVAALARRPDLVDAVGKLVAVSRRATQPVLARGSTLEVRQHSHAHCSAYMGSTDMVELAEGSINLVRALAEELKT